MQVAFPKPEDEWIPGLRWREMRSKRYHLEKITEAGFTTPTTGEDCCVPPQNKYKFSDFFDRPVFAEKSALWESSKEIIHKFIWMEETSQGNFPRLMLRAGGNCNVWRKIS